MPANESGPSVKKKGRRARLLVLVMVLALLAVIGYGAYWSVDTVRASFPQTTGSLKVPGLTGTVDVKRDEHGIPQLYADNDEDLFRAQGFVHAQDRFWEMDVRRHMTSGRLSEMFGSGQVETDAFLRTLGWRQVAQAEYDTKLSPETKKYLQAYADGVNAYLKGKSGKDLSVEHAALKLTGDYQPEQWTPVDSVAWLKAMAWDLRGNMQDEIDRSLMSGTLSPAQIDELYPPYPFDRNKPIVEGGAVAGGKYAPRAPRAPARPAPAPARAPVRAPPAPAPARRAPARERVRDPARAPAPARRPSPTAAAPASPATPPPRARRWACARSSPPSPRPWTRSRPSSAPTAAASARTPGSSAASTRRPASRSSRTTRTSRRSCPRSGTRSACTAAPPRPSVSTTWPATASRACPAWSSATTPTSPGA